MHVDVPLLNLKIPKRVKGENMTKGSNRLTFDLKTSYMSKSVKLVMVSV